MSSLINYQQPDSYGCIYHSFASLLQDPSWIEGQRRVWGDCSYTRFRIRAARKGWLLNPVFVHPPDDPEARVLEEMWGRVVAWSGANTSVFGGFHCTIPSLRFEDTRHKVGVRAQDEQVIVFDPASGSEEPERFGLQAFLESPYAQTQEVWEVRKHKLSDHPAYPGWEHEDEMVRKTGEGD